MRQFVYVDFLWDEPSEEDYEIWEEEQREIRAELATREHIPRGKDAKEHRKLMAKKHKGGRRSHKKK